MLELAIVACADDQQVEAHVSQDPPLSLLTLPIDVLEAICAGLSLQDMIALTSCCRAMLARPDVLSSQALWGGLAAEWAAEEQRRYMDQESLLQKLPGQPPLAAWLARRLDGLRTLWLKLSGEADAEEVAGALAHASRLAHLELNFDSGSIACIPPCLASLPPSALVALEARGCHRLGEGGASALAALRHCTALTRLNLYGCGLRCLPGDVFSSLPALAELGIGNNSGLQCGSGLELARLTALTRLDLDGTPIARLPEQLATLPALRSLEMEVEQHLGQGEVADWAPLGSCLQRLRLQAQKEARQLPGHLPLQLSVLTKVEYLILDRSLDLGAQGIHRTALKPIRHLTALTTLSLYDCNMCGGLPPQLSALRRLVSLSIGHNKHLGDVEDEAAFEPLRHLTALTHLFASYSGLRMVPPQLCACTRLASLYLGWNRRLSGSQGNWQVLEHLQSLTYLDLTDCNLQELPPQLSACTALHKLDMRENYLGTWREHALQLEPLRHLTVLKYLDVRSLAPQIWPDGDFPLVLRKLVANGLVLLQSL